MPNYVHIEVPPGTLDPGAAAWLEASGIGHAVAGAYETVSLPEGSPATRMEPGLVAALIRLKLLTKAGTPQPVNYTSPDWYLIGTDPIGTYHAESMLASGWTKAEVAELIDAAKSAGLERASSDMSQQVAIRENVLEYLRFVEAWPYAQTPGGGKPRAGSPVATLEQRAAANAGRPLVNPMDDNLQFERRPALPTLHNVVTKMLSEKKSRTWTKAKIWAALEAAIA